MYYKLLPFILPDWAIFYSPSVYINFVLVYNLNLQRGYSLMKGNSHESFCNPKYAD